ncbi:MAG: hypothetical protein DRI56_06755 [Chloroflexota bacterium]|nr:MAG: hypothetical protein DRI56_06755 [Chloroflexota bacterium]
MPNFAHPEAGCDWLGIAGQVFNGDIAVENLVVIVGGTLDGDPLDMLTMTGLAPGYGSGGYEFVLSSAVVASESTVWVQVLGLDGQPLTAKTYVDTHSECMENLILLNFVLKGE